MQYGKDPPTRAPGLPRAEMAGSFQPCQELTGVDLAQPRRVGNIGR